MNRMYTLYVGFLYFYEKKKCVGKIENSTFKFVYCSNRRGIKLNELQRKVRERAEFPVSKRISNDIPTISQRTILNF